MTSMSNTANMSCIEFVDKFVDEPLSSKREEIINEVLECFRAQEEIRTKELNDFIEDFVNSQEYADYVRDKRNITKRSAAIQCDSNDILVECQKNGEVVKYPLTEEQKKMFAFKLHFEEYAERQQREAEIKKQENSIYIIKTKIDEARRLFECTVLSKQMEKEKRDRYFLKKYSTKFGIDLKYLSENTQMKLVERFKKCHEVSVLRKKKKQDNVYKMIDKLLFEYRIDKQKIAREKVNKYDYKMKTREKIIEDMEVVGTKIELIDRRKPKKSLEPEPPKVEEDLTEVQSIKKKKPDSKKEKVSKKEMTGKKEKKPGEKKAKEKKTKEKKEKPEEKLYLPIFPIINPREKVLPENIDLMLDLVDEFREFDEAMENRDMWQNRKNFLLEDSGLQSKPHEVTFHNFDEGKTYSRTIRITNASSQIRKIRFLKFAFPDEYDEVVFEINAVGIRKLYTGCSAKFSVKFEPYDTFKSYDGKIVFLSYDIRLCQYFQLEVAVRCIPKYSELKICPDVVQFGCIPIWNARSYKNFKIIKLKNQGAKSCTVYIRKVLDPLDLEPILEEEENKENVVPKNSATEFHDVCEILDDCLKNIDNNFQFEHGFFTLDAFEERRVKVFFKNASYVGYYFEKYTVDVYEMFERGCLDTAGCQTISLHAETTGHFVTVSPDILDFGTCVMNSCYQLSFEIHNGSNKSQAISVRVPSSLTDIVLPDIGTVYMSPNSDQTVFLKLSPRPSIKRNFTPYFDKESSILEFPVQVYVVSRGAEPCPPVKVAVYAVVANFDDLTISCGSTANLSNFLNTLLIDMGDCSIYETIWTDISLTNNTDVSQVCGFVDLPEAVTLVPNYGFCKLYPGQRKKFKLYINPEIKDYPSYVIGSLRNSSFFFKIVVETVVSLGQLDREINPKRRCTEITLDQSPNDMFSTSISGYVNDIKENFINISNPTRSQSMENKEDYQNLASRVCSLVPQRSGSTQDNLGEDKSVDTVLNYQNFLIVETTSRKEVWLKSNLKRPLLEFSQQTVEFPDTPCGSYSVMEIGLQALEQEMEKFCRKKRGPLTYQARFQIVGGTDEIRVEPTCGLLKAGDAGRPLEAKTSGYEFTRHERQQAAMRQAISCDRGRPLQAALAAGSSLFSSSDSSEVELNNVCAHRFINKNR